MKLGDGARNVGKDGLEMAEDLSLVRASGAGRARGRIGRGAEEGGTEAALSAAKPAPDPLPGAFAESSLNGPDSGRECAGDGQEEEGPQQAYPFGEPHI